MINAFYIFGRAVIQQPQFVINVFVDCCVEGFQGPIRIIDLIETGNNNAYPGFSERLFLGNRYLTKSRILLCLIFNRKRIPDASTSLNA